MTQVVSKFRLLRVGEVLSYGKYLKNFFEESEVFDQAGERLQALTNEINLLDPLEQEIKQVEKRLESLNRKAAEARRRINKVTGKLVNYVNDIADGDEAIAAQGPFPLKDPARSKGEATLTRILSVVNLPDRDRVQVSWERAEVGRAYEVWYSLIPEVESSWKLLGSSISALRIRAHIRIDGDGVDRRQAAPLVTFRVAAVIGGKRGPWSKTAAEYVS